MNQKSAIYLVVGPLAYRLTSNHSIACDTMYAQFLQTEPLASDKEVRLFVECELKVADGEIPIDGQLVYQDPVNSIFVNDQGYETRVLAFEGKPYAVCRESFKASLELILAKVWLSDSHIFVNQPILEALMMERYMMMCKGLILHSSFIVDDGYAILFTAPSGTGKSTQAALWEKYAGAEIINGDRSVVWSDNQHFMASGLPFCGSSGINKVRTVSLGSIVFIEQAPNNSAEPMSTSVAARKLFGEMSINKWNQGFVSQSLDLIERLVASVPMVRLKCNMEEGAVTTLRTYLTQIKKNDG